MHRSNFGRLFLVALACASFTLTTCSPVDSSAFTSVDTERTRENKIAKKYLPGLPQFAETRGEHPATFLDDLRLGNTSPERKILLKRPMMRENGRSPFVVPVNNILDQAKSTVLQKRVFYDGRRGSPSFPDTNIPKRPGTEMLKTRKMNGKPLREDVTASDAARQLKALLSLRDRAKAVHEEINDSIERYRQGTKVADSVREYAQMASKMREQEDEAQEWDRILHGFEVD